MGKYLNLLIACMAATLSLTAHATLEGHMPTTWQAVRKNLRDVPIKFKISRPKVAPLQEQLFREFNIIAVDVTDNHSPVVLENFLFLLRNAFNDESVRGLKYLQYLYSYKGHDRSLNMAAFHLEAKAISVAGVRSYPTGSDDTIQVQLLATLAHEIGHAFLFEKVSFEELQKISGTYGDWGPLFKDRSAQDLMSRLFFIPHPLYRRFRYRDPLDLKIDAKIGHSRWKKDNMTSGYAAINIHEWFADAFAAVVLNRLGQRDLLGPDWQEKLIVKPRHPKEYWVNYNNFSPEFDHWLEAKAADILK